MTQDNPYAGLGEAARQFLARSNRLLINGEWVAPQSGKSFPSIDPSTEQVVAHIAEGNAADIDRAVQAARQAFEGGSAWRRMRPVERERLLLKLADLVEQNADELAQLESLDNGKSCVLARFIDVQGTVDYLRYMAGWATKIEGRTLDVSPGIPNVEFQAMTLREPIGVVGQIIPWNFPLSMAAWKIAPALATGCTLILKPAEQTSLTALRLGELVMEAGYPAGVFNVVTGFGEVVGDALVRHPGVDKIAFTGSTAVGKLIGKAALDTLKRVSLELGGKSPVIVGADANIEHAVHGAANAIFFNHGQVCAAGSRLYVAESIFDQVVQGVADVARNTKLGPGFDPSIGMGPLVSEEQMNRVLGYIERGRAEGGTVLAGGKRAPGKGYFVEPTVFTGFGPQATLVREEIFGPVLVAAPFRSEDDIAAIANSSEFGLAASIHSNDHAFVQRMTKRLRAGTIWVNCHGLVDPNLPFGGFKQSGYGRENGREAIELYTESKSVLSMF